MMRDQTFFREAVVKTALPITLQSLFQASFSVVDQIMTGQLGSVAVAGIGLGGKFSSMFSVIVAAIASGAGILISQFTGSSIEEKEKRRGVARSFWRNMLYGVLLAVVFTIAGTAFSNPVMSLYSKDPATIQAAAGYLVIISVGFLPSVGSLMISTLLRCHGYAKFPLYATVVSAVVNTGLNYILIFGKLGCPAMGMEGAAYATTASRVAEFLILFVFLLVVLAKKKIHLPFILNADEKFHRLTFTILLPLLGCEFLWTLGENVYAMIYGRIGTDACAAMTLTGPVQSLMIGALTGIAQATGIMVGKELGSGNTESAYAMSKKFLKYGAITSIVLSVILVAASPLYVQIYEVEEEVKQLTKYILYAYSVIAPVKVLNMILGGGVLRSGGKTKYVMFIDAVGTWVFGVPLGLLSAYVFGLPVYWVYFILSMEEAVRLIISLVLFKKRSWMENLTE